MQRYSPTVVIGAGQSGLAVSAELSRHGMDHLVLERGQVANSWKSERWDSLKMLTPNWMNLLPGIGYDGDAPSGFMSVQELSTAFDRSARAIAAPIQTETRVLSVTQKPDGYQIQTDQGALACRNLVMANGACGIPSVPEMAKSLSPGILQTTPMQYKRPSDLPVGKVLVVGASASGQQLARELVQSGRDVILSVGNHIRLPRTYRGVDICVWLDILGTTSIPYDQVDDLDRVRRTQSLSLVANTNLDLNVLQDMGVEIAGRLVSGEGESLAFAGSLANTCVAADLKMKRFLSSVDDWIAARGMQRQFDAQNDISMTRVPAMPRLLIKNLKEYGVRSILWATGYRPDFSWLDLPVFDPKGRLVHDGGVVGNGLYVMGLPYLRQRKSTNLQGAGEDAKALVKHMRLQAKAGDTYNLGALAA